MKKIMAFILLLICCLSLSGCVRYRTEIDIKNNGKADISVLFATKDLDYDLGQSQPEENDDSSNQTFSEDLEGDANKFKNQISEAEKEGWQYKKYSKNEFTGYELIKKNVNIDELAKELNSKFYDPEEGSALVDQDDIFDDNKFSVKRKGLKYVVDLPWANDGITNQLAARKSYFDMSGGYMKFILNLPRKTTNSNATSISNDGKTLTWNLLDMKDQQGIHFEFYLIDVYMIAGCLGVLVLVATGVVIILRQKQKYDD